MSSTPRAGPGFAYPKPMGKYNHPWMQQLPPGRAKVYDLLYKSVTTVLAVAAAYTFYETTKGTYHILLASRQRSKEILEKSETQ